MIVYRVPPHEVAIHSMQVERVTIDAVYVKSGHNTHRTPRSRGGARIFDTRDEAKAWIVERERIKIAFHRERIAHHLEQIDKAEKL